MLLRLLHVDPLTYCFKNGVSCNGCVDYAVWCLLYVDCGGWSRWRVRRVRRPLPVFRVCVDMHVCVPRAGCVAAGIWIGAVTGHCAAVVCSRVSFGVSH